MSVIFANFFRPGFWPLSLPVLLLGALGPTLLQARGARALWLAAVGLGLARAVAQWLITPAGQSLLLGDLAIWLALADRFRWAAPPSKEAA